MASDFQPVLPADMWRESKLMELNKSREWTLEHTEYSYDPCMVANSLIDAKDLFA